VSASASTIAAMLETTTAAINSALQRARATLEKTPVRVDRDATARAGLMALDGAD
jgi:DNA-directed RNA polymerase specialized sigma24 family protein